VNDPHVSRREFSQRVACSAGLAVSGLARGAAEARGGPQENADAKPPGQPEARPLEREDLELLALIRQYPGEHLTDEMLSGIRAGLRRNRQQAERLRAVGLQNSDEPAFVFRAYRRE
jgi:hypothetical protein